MQQSGNDKSAAWITIAIILLVVAAAGGYYVITQMGGDNSSQAAATVEPTAGERQGHSEENASLERIIAARRTWDTDFVSSFGEPIADFSVRDITGVEHKLSDYRGKHVVVVFWTTWCPACNMEIPHLIKLREALGPDKLQILAISNEPVDVLKPFVDSRQINYVVVTVNSPLPAPLDRVQGIPATIFIDPDGKLKLAAVGVVSLEEDIAIINAL
ncbi:MAG: TlpA family protein disulfide reductase [Planctomycetes bacterium]|nr:TlpA family protein disulfide reductase [Planctomycetota bacterium]